MKLCRFVTVLLLLILATSCGAPTPAETPTSLPEPPQELLDAVPFAVPKEGPTNAWQEARRLSFAAYVLQLQRELEQAIKQYQRSIDTFPIAEATPLSNVATTFRTPSGSPVFGGIDKATFSI